MPRLSSRDYLINRRLLCQQWIELGGTAFGDLPVQAQLDLHDYYAPSMPITDEQALRHRADMSKAFPSLPQKAGRAFDALRSGLDGTPNRIVESHRAKTMSHMSIAGKEYSVRIAAIARAEIDYYRLARAMVNFMTADVNGELLAKAKKLRDRRSP